MGEGEGKEKNQGRRKAAMCWFPCCHSAQFNPSIRTRTVAADYWSVWSNQLAQATRRKYRISGRWDAEVDSGKRARSLGVAGSAIKKDSLCLHAPAERRKFTKYSYIFSMYQGPTTDFQTRVPITSSKKEVQGHKGTLTRPVANEP
jgi:hypothetical protein